MQFFEDNLTGRIGGALQAIGGASVTVTTSAGAAATVYSNDAGTTVQAQPIITDSAGYFGFHAPDGSYTLTFAGPTFATFTRHIHLLDSAGVQAFAADQLSAMTALRNDTAASRDSASGFATDATASRNAAAQSATNAATSATSASASATTASTAANSATASASTASDAASSATTSASAASASASAATTKASNAADSATNANSSAMAASSSASAASTSASNAAQSATTASNANSSANAYANASAANAATVAAVNTAVQGYRDQSASSALQALSARDAALIAAQAATAPTELLAAYAQSIHSGNVVRAFQYDVAKDSDGGAWIKRCQHTSWYTEAIQTGAWRGQQANLTAAWNVTGAAAGDYYQNSTDGKFYAIGGTKAAPTQAEVFRGNSREFPALSAIIAEAARVVVYDLTKPGAPMWRVFKCDGSANWWGTGSAVTSITAINGSLYAGSNGGGLRQADFIKDTFKSGSTADGNGPLGGVATSNGAINWGGTGRYVIVNATVNDLAATVLSGAPVDPATSLPVPTIACLVGDSMVLMADGEEKRIDEMVAGDFVQCTDDAGNLYQREVLNFFDQGIKDIIELAFSDGSIIKCTEDHLIRTTEGWIPAGELQVHHQIVSVEKAVIASSAGLPLPHITPSTRYAVRPNAQRNKAAEPCGNGNTKLADPKDRKKTFGRQQISSSCAATSSCQPRKSRAAWGALLVRSGKSVRAIACRTWRIASNAAPFFKESTSIACAWTARLRSRTMSRLTAMGLMAGGRCTNQTRKSAGLNLASPFPNSRRSGKRAAITAGAKLNTLAWIASTAARVMSLGISSHAARGATK